jgi:hypothetical protein
MTQPGPSGRSTVVRGAVVVLLTIAIAGTLWVPIYARSVPKLGPFPFFYWYQVFWIPISAALCWISYLVLKIRRHGRGAHR